ncbi:nucleotide-diphospho-sugar transferases family [Trichomonas vaginalis G3]|nr:nucleotide-diphospho-sugar transferases family [Trichomonas vaginalis G3]KAI5549010.1 nucleotide-diphospho-sugar transferases family [Trichomonas vaginalis G3]
MFLCWLIFLYQEAEQEKRPNSYYYFNDPPAKTRYAYLSGYTGDDDSGHYFVLAITCGYSLLKTSPNFDRVLMIPSEMKIPPEKMKLLKQIWTHILYRPYIQWPDGYIDTHARDMYLWFKLNAWSVVGWEKLLWTGTDVVFRRDPSSVFDFPPPCSIIDHYVYGMSHIGPVTNGDFFLLKPSLKTYSEMKTLALDWAKDPDEYGHKLQLQGASWTGPHDQGLITQYFDGNITTVPQWYQLEVPGNPASMLGLNNTENPDPRVISFHFPSTIKPWKKDAGPYSHAWSAIAYEAFDYLQVSIDLIGKGFPRPSGKIHPNLLFAIEQPRNAEPARIIDQDDGIDPKILFPPNNFRARKIVRIYAYIIFCNLLFLAIFTHGMCNIQEERQYQRL